MADRAEVMTMIYSARKLVVARAVESRRRAILSQCWRSLCLNAKDTQLLRDRKSFRQMLQQQQLRIVEQQEELQRRTLPGGTEAMTAAQPLPVPGESQAQQRADEEGRSQQWGATALQRMLGALRSMS